MQETSLWATAQQEVIKIQQVLSEQQNVTFLFSSAEVILYLKHNELNQNTAV